MARFFVKCCIASYKYIKKEDWDRKFPDAKLIMRISNGENGTAVCILEQNDKIIIVFRGSCNFSNIMTDIKSTMLHFPGHKNVKSSLWLS
eukprot:UN00973